MNYKGSIFHSFSILFSGSCFAGLLNLAFYPIFSRIYSKEDFGILAVLTAVTSFLCIFSTGKYEQAVLVAKNDKEAVGLLKISVLICIILCAVFFLIVLTPLSNSIALLFTKERGDVIRNLLWLCPFAVLGISVYNCYNEWCVRKKLYSSLTINRCCNSVLITLLKWICHFFPNGLSFGDVFGRFLSGGQSFGQFLYVGRQVLKENKASAQELRGLVREYAHFPRFILADQGINYFAGNLPVFFVSNYFGLGVLGSFTMANSILAIPAAFLEKALMDLFRSQACDEFTKTGKCRKIYKMIFLYLLIPSVVCGGIAILLIPWAFRVFLGDQWTEAGKIAQILFPAIILRFLFMTFSPVWVITEKLKYRLFWQICFVSLNAIALTIGCFFMKDQQFAFLLLSAAWGLSYLLGIINTWYLANGHHA